MSVEEPRRFGFGWRTWSVIGCLLAMGVAGLGLVLFLLPGAPRPTIDRPESADVLSSVRCTLVLSGNGGTGVRELTILDLPEGKPRTLALDHPALGVSAIARNGRLAYLSIGILWGLELYLKDVVSGAETLVLERGGRHDLFSNVAISPDGTYLALLSADYQGASPRTLEILDGSGRVLQAFEAGFAPKGPRWFPDGKRFAFVRGPDVCVAHVDQGELFTIARAECPVTGASNSVLLVVDTRDPHHDPPRIHEGKTSWLFRRYDVDRQEYLDPLELPGDLFGPLGFTAGGHVLYEGLTTTGAEWRPLHGLTWPTWTWTIKACDPSTGGFATVIPEYAGERIAFGLRE